MRIKIHGEITADRLKEALDEALSAFVDVPNVQFYGADLYLQVYDAEGEHIKLYEPDGNEMILRLHAPKGGLARPALTGEALRRREEASAKASAEQAAREEQQRIQDAEREERRRVEQEAAEKYWRERKERASQGQRLFDECNRITAHAIETNPERFICALNNVLIAVWNEFQPLEFSGALTGQPKPLPVFQIGLEGLEIVVPTRKYPRQLKNPAFLLSQCGSGPDGLEPLWKHPVWQKASARICDVLIDFRQDVIQTSELE